MLVLRELLPFLVLAGAAGAAGSPRLANAPAVAAIASLGKPAARLPLAPLAIGGALCLALSLVRLAVSRAAASEGTGARAPGLRRSLGVLLRAEWLVAATFATLALLPALPDRRIPAALAVLGAALLLIDWLVAGARRRAPPLRGDERHWIAGVLYANPRDRAVLVPARLGVGLALNLGRPLGWLLLVAALGLPALAGVWFAGW